VPLGAAELIEEIKRGGEGEGDWHKRDSTTVHKENLRGLLSDCGANASRRMVTGGKKKGRSKSTIFLQQGRRGKSAKSGTYFRGGLQSPERQGRWREEQKSRKILKMLRKEKCGPTDQALRFYKRKGRVAGREATGGIEEYDEGRNSPYAPKKKKRFKKRGPSSKSRHKKGGRRRSPNRVLLE